MKVYIQKIAIIALSVFVLMFPQKAKASELVPFEDLYQPIGNYFMGTVKVGDTLKNYPNNYMEFQSDITPAPLVTYSCTTVSVGSNDRFAFYSTNDNGKIGITSIGSKPYMAICDWDENQVCQSISYRYVDCINKQFVISGGGYISTSFTPRSIVGSTFNAMIFKDYNSARNYCQTGVYSNDDLIYYVPEENNYNTDIGYLLGLDKNYTEEVLTEGGFGLMSGSNLDKKYCFMWKRETSTGFDLLNNDCYVKISVSPKFNITLHDGSEYHHTLDGELFELIKLKDNLSYKVAYSELMDCIKGYKKEVDDANGSWWNPPSIEIKWEFYFQVCFAGKHGVCYGDIIRFSPSKGYDKFEQNNHSAQGVIVLGVEGNGTNFIVDPNSVYGIGTHVQGSRGYGNTWDDASFDTGTNIKVDNSLISNLDDFVSQIGNVPKIITSIFSFLPSWLLGYISIAFGLTVTALVLKIIRG